MNTVETLIAFLRQELADQPDAAIGPEDNLLLTGRIDSLGVMRLVAFIEEEYDLEVPPEDVTIENFLSPRRIADYIAGRVAVGE